MVELRPVFAAAPDEDVRYVQHRLWKDRADVIALFRQGAHVFVCGDGRNMAPTVRATCVRMYQEATGSTEEAAEVWANEIELSSSSYVADVFA